MPDVLVKSLGECEFIYDYVDEEDAPQPAEPQQALELPLARRDPRRGPGPIAELNATRAKDEALAAATAGAIERTATKKRKSKRSTDTPLLD